MRQCSTWMVFLAAVIFFSPALAWAQNPAAPPADVHHQLQEILQRPIYERWQLRQEREQPQESSVAAALRSQINKWGEWLGDILRSLFRSKPHASSPGAPGLGAGLSALFQAIAWIALGLFAIALVILVVRLLQAGRDKDSMGVILSREQVADALSEGDALALRGDQWLDEAARLAAEKDFRAMYRALYLALLSGLHAKGKIVFDRHHTNWTYVSRYRGDSGEREVFSSLTELFDSVWYGLKASGGEDIQSLRRQVENLTGPALAAGGAAHAL